MSGGGPHGRLADSVSSYLGGSPPGPLPKRWERFSDVVLLPSDAFTEGDWSGFRNEGLWRAVAKGLDASRLGQMGEVSGETRESGVKMLLGDDDWVVRRESGVDYGYNLTKCMFSAGNVNERRRMGEVANTGDVVVDMFSGIGYYSLPILIHSKASHVHCCEWNPEAVNALKWNLQQNGVEGRCTIHEGDNRQAAIELDGVSDRVILGLLPSAEGSFEAALGVLKKSGGTLHVHGLAKPGSHNEWSGEITAKLRSIRPGSDFVVTELVRVKSYAPRWDHMVLDIDVI